MKTLSNELLRELIHHASDICISIYLPMMRTGNGTGQNRTRFKNMIKGTREKLTRMNLKKTDQTEILKPAVSILNDRSFWAYQEEGLAVFISRGSFLNFKFPVSFSPELHISDHFYIKPLLPLLTNDGTYYVLALNLDRVWLYRGSRYSLEEVEFDAPPGIEEALGFDDNEVLRQSASRTAQARGDRNAMFFGHGLEIEENKNRILRYFRKIDEAVHPVVQGRTEPLVLAGNDYLIPIYLEANTYPHTVERAVKKNAQAMDVSELHRESWKIMEPGFVAAQKGEYERYRQLARTAMVSDDLREVVRSAANNRIETLFIEKDTHIWGRYNSADFSVHVHTSYQDGDEDLLDFAAVETILHNGNVFVTDLSEIPGNQPVSAIFRF